MTEKKTENCGVCLLGKMVQERRRIPDPKASQPLELEHFDIAGPIEPAAKEGFRYALIFPDNYSGVTMLYSLKHKSDTLQATKDFLADVAPSSKIKRLRRWK